ncbi:tissue inhibitor of metalloproteinase [Contarinia nasturtii]|uniref:tissue inhibitor of metalloproteinase n=1 Tax=Contarinia nasturtii TaxID=265458 RepID=UPI0012D3E0B5|nr:tissue inhibitor of metalloproteinase [Contarinia nasturtii]XP_031625537.1 tissue inhibitor of metalloproteinase [Contarinia nasturtii]XP_031625538.1 tissue inhibitor of metalloproteinase [Contarinia nasturtii]
MMMRQLAGVTVLATIAIMLMQIQSSTACMCMPKHSQSWYCDSDYVILARVLRKSNQKINFHDVYKIEVKKAYKKSPQTDSFLREGRILTPGIDSLCGGLNLKVGKLYLIAGNSQMINICNYVKEYSQMTIVERRGFAGGYKKGCVCEIKPMFQMEGFHQSIGACNWRPFTKCETDYGACVPARGHYTPEGKPLKCHWRPSQPYNTCKARLTERRDQLF